MQPPENAQALADADAATARPARAGAIMAMEQAVEYAREGLSPSSQRAYRSDWMQFEIWCQRVGLIFVYPVDQAGQPSVAPHLLALCHLRAPRFMGLLRHATEIGGVCHRRVDGGLESMVLWRVQTCFAPDGLTNARHEDDSGTHDVREHRPDAESTLARKPVHLLDDENSATRHLAPLDQSKEMLEVPSRPTVPLVPAETSILERSPWFEPEVPADLLEDLFLPLDARTLALGRA